MALTEDVLYVREDRVLAFNGGITWEAGLTLTVNSSSSPVSGCVPLQTAASSW